MTNELLQDNGYVIFPNTVPHELCDAVVEDIVEHSDGGNRAGWEGMVEMYHYQSMWDVRQHPTVHSAFSKVLGTGDLWVSIDRCNYKIPVAADKDPGAFVDDGFIHWDENPNQRPRHDPPQVQGVIALTDTDKNMGGFQCVPELYCHLDEWLNGLPTGKAVYSHFNVHDGRAWVLVPTDWSKEYRKKLQTGSWPIEKVPMKKGDLLIWDSLLPHGNGVNRGSVPRIAQYVTMFPPGDRRLQRERYECWFWNTPPSGFAFPGDPRGLEQQKDGADLTSLGRKLLGVPW